jgi:excisionase family DNA binding protein
MMPFDVLTVSQVAKYLQLPETTILEEANAGRLPGRCIAGQWRFILVALTDWLRETEGTSYVNGRPRSNNEPSSSDEETESLLAEIRASRRNLGTVGDWYPDEGAE